MAIRGEQERRLRNSVFQILVSHVGKFIDNDKLNDLLDDTMGAVNQEDIYRVKDFQDETDNLRRKMQSEHHAQIQELEERLAKVTEERDNYKAKCSDTHKDSVIKELERKLGKANERVSVLKKMTKLFLEEI